MTGVLSASHPQGVDGRKGLPGDPGPIGPKVLSVYMYMSNIIQVCVLLLNACTYISHSVC